VGLLAGFAFAAKYTAFVAAAYALGFVAWKTWRKRQALLRPVLVVGLCAAVSILPWMVKNWIYVQNPLSPFMNAVFPNPYIWIGFERDYAAEFRLDAYGLKSYGELPLAVTAQGQPAGLLGPLFLLAPVALVSLWSPAGRQLLLAVGVFGSTYFANVGTRFLIPPLPFLALAMALAFVRVRYLAPALVILHAVLSFPAVVPRYADRFAWRISGMPWRAALRIVPEEKFLNEKLSNYIISRVIERVVPPGARVLTFGPVAESYTSRDVPVVYESAMGKVLGTILWSPMIPEYAPTWNLSFRFPAQPLRKVRVVQTAAGGPDYWTVSELRVFGQGRELERAAQWRLRAKPNPWHVQMAFDNSYMTRWSSGETLYPGMFVEVDFGRPETVDRVLVQCSHDQYKIRLKLEGQDAAGKWKPLAAAPEESNAPPMFNMRRAATDELKFRGIDYVLIWDSDFGAEDFRRKADAWGISVVGEGPGARLYRIL
jgi:hypothetical protein